MTSHAISHRRDQELLRAIAMRLRRQGSAIDLNKARRIYRSRLARGHSVLISLLAAVAASRVSAAAKETDDLSALPVANSLEDLAALGEMCIPGLSYGLAGDDAHDHAADDRALHFYTHGGGHHGDHAAAHHGPFASRFASKYDRGHDDHRNHNDHRADGHDAHESHAVQHAAHTGAGHQGHGQHHGHGAHGAHGDHSIHGSVDENGHHVHGADYPAHHGLHHGQVAAHEAHAAHGTAQHVAHGAGHGGHAHPLTTEARPHTDHADGDSHDHRHEDPVALNAAEAPEQPVVLAAAGVAPLATSVTTALSRAGDHNNHGRETEARDTSRDEDAVAAG
ncbi:MAG: hypothetical protein ACX939_11575, partial [Hyphococcus sp.]